MSKKSSNPFARKLSVQVGVCKRMSKEADYYVKEVAENTAKVEKMKADEKDPYDIKKQEEVLDESIMMVPDSRRRLGEAIDKLAELLEMDADQNHDEGNVEIIEEARQIVARFREEEAQKE